MVYDFSSEYSYELCLEFLYRRIRLSLSESMNRSVLLFQ